MKQLCSSGTSERTECSFMAEADKFMEGIIWPRLCVSSGPTTGNFAKQELC